MLFHSKAFALFFPLVVLVFFLTPARRRWVVLLGASYFFYMSWNAAYAVLLLASTTLDYFVAFRVHRASEKGRRLAWACVSLAANLGMLGYFKYANFGIESLNAILQTFGMEGISWTKVVLPVGIS